MKKDEHIRDTVVIAIVLQKQAAVSLQLIFL